MTIAAPTKTMSDLRLTRLLYGFIPTAFSLPDRAVMAEKASRASVTSSR